MNFMRLSSMKAAREDVAWCRVQEELAAFDLDDLTRCCLGCHRFSTLAATYPWRQATSAGGVSCFFSGERRFTYASPFRCLVNLKEKDKVEQSMNQLRTTLLSQVTVFKQDLSDSFANG
jgi:hypothetical protein